jgi:alanyl-tRNA synthetase
MSAADSVEPTPTVVTYPLGSLREQAMVIEVSRDPRPASAGRLLVITDVTPFHPLDPLWPDQPADHGELLVDGLRGTVHDSVTVARRAGGPLMVDDGIDARRDEPGVVFRVAHSVDGELEPHLPVGARTTLIVDGIRRRRLSAAHTACHLLAYALNEATHELWGKPTHRDSRGHYDLDRATCVHTSHDIGGSLDRYRFGKSLRKRGFDSARFLAELPRIVERVNRRLAEWIEADAVVRIECAGPLLTDRRRWLCLLPGGTAQMPCGGTHVTRLAEFEAMRATADFDADTGLLTIRNATRTVPRYRAHSGTSATAAPLPHCL